MHFHSTASLNSSNNTRFSAGLNKGDARLHTCPMGLNNWSRLTWDNTMVDGFVVEIDGATTREDNPHDHHIRPERMPASSSNLDRLS